MRRSSRYDSDDGSYGSISHHVLRPEEREIFLRTVEVGESLPNPISTVDFSNLQATSQRPLILTEDRILVDDSDTRDSSDDTKLDASSIEFRVTKIVDGTLKRRSARDSDTWREIGLTHGTLYREFSLEDLRGGLIAFFPNAGVSTLEFDIQAADDAPNLSDSDRSTPTPDPESASVSVVVLKEIEAGEKGALNDDVPTPDDNTLGAWIAADGTLRIFVELQGGKSGIVVPEEGEVAEFLSLSAVVSNITATWDGTNDRLSLQGSAYATVGNFEAALQALQLQTVRFKEDSYRTVSVGPFRRCSQEGILCTRGESRGVVPGAFSRCARFSGNIDR